MCPRNGLKREPCAQKRFMLCLQQECSGEVGRQMDCPYTTQSVPRLEASSGQRSYVGLGC